MQTPSSSGVFGPGYDESTSGSFETFNLCNEVSFLIGKIIPIYVCIKAILIQLHCQSSTPIQMLFYIFKYLKV